MTETQNPIVDPAAMTGYEQLVAMRDGRIPPAPISALVGMVDFDGEVGAMRVALVPDQRHYNPLGTVHGGVIATLLDTAAGCSVHSTLGVGEGYTSLDLTVKFLRAVTAETGRVEAHGKVLQRGRRTALAEAQIVDGQGRLLAHATSSCLIFS